MNRTYRDILLEILSICGYPNDKEAFIIKFEDANHAEALANTIEKLPFAVQEQIISYNSNIEKIKPLIPQEEFTAELLKVSADALTGFLEAMAPVLTREQKEQIYSLITQAQLSA